MMKFRYQLWEGWRIGGGIVDQKMIQFIWSEEPLDERDVWERKDGRVRWIKRMVLVDREHVLPEQRDWMPRES